jgi:hypothetical protein
MEHGGHTASVQRGEAEEVTRSEGSFRIGAALASASPMPTRFKHFVCFAFWMVTFPRAASSSVPP